MSSLPIDPVTEQLPVTLPAGRPDARGAPGAPVVHLPITVAGIGVAAVLTLLVGAWTGVVPFAGPRFGFAPAGATPWHWRFVDGTLSAVPGAVAVLGAIVMLIALFRTRIGAGRVLLVLAGTLTASAGAWTIVGPWALPLVSNVGSPYAHVAGVQDFGRLVGYHLGPGVVLVGTGVAAAVLGNQHRTVRFAIAY